MITFLMVTTVSLRILHVMLRQDESKKGKLREVVLVDGE